MKRLPWSLVVAITFTLAGRAMAASPTPVTCGATIAISGVYQLSGDCTGPGINISASHVSLLLGGYTMTDSTPGSGNGIEPYNVSDVAILGPGKITKYSSGIFFLSVTNSDVISVNSSGNAEGVELYGLSSDNRIIANSTQNNSSNGIVLSPSTSSNRVYNNQVSRNQTGIGVNAGSTDNMIYGNAALHNSTTDMEDDNAGCDNNEWVGNRFNNAIPASCIN